MTALYPSRGWHSDPQQGPSLMSVPEHIELGTLQKTSTTDDETATTRVVELEVARARSATFSSSTWSLTTASSSSTASSSKATIRPGGGRRHQVSGTIKTPPPGGTGSSASPSTSTPAKIYTPQQLRLLNAESVSGAFAPGGGRRHHIPQKKPSSSRKKANSLKSPSLTRIHSPSLGDLSESLATTQMFRSALSGGGTGSGLHNHMVVDPHHLEPRNYVLQTAPTNFVAIPLAPHKYNTTWHYGARVQVPQRGGASNSVVQPVEYDIWRRWEDCLKLQRLVEKEYTSLASERRAFLAEQNFRRPYPSERAASFDSLPSGTNPLSISLDVHKRLPTLSKKPKKLPSQLQVIDASYSAVAGEDGVGLAEAAGASGSVGKLTKAKRRPSLFPVGSSHTQALTAQARGEEFAAFLNALFRSKDYLIELVRASDSVKGWFGWWKRDRDSLDKRVRQGDTGAVASAGERRHTINAGSNGGSGNNNDSQSHPSDNGKGEERELLGTSTATNVSNAGVKHTPPHPTTSISSSGAISPNLPLTPAPAPAGTAPPSSNPPSTQSGLYHYDGQSSPSPSQLRINTLPAQRSPSSLTLLSSFPVSSMPPSVGPAAAPAQRLPAHSSAYDGITSRRSSSLPQKAPVKRPRTAPTYALSPPSFSPPLPPTLSSPPIIAPPASMDPSGLSFASAARRPSTSTGASMPRVHYRKPSDRLSVSSLNDALAETLAGFPMPPSSLIYHMRDSAPSSSPPHSTFSPVSDTGAESRRGHVIFAPTHSPKHGTEVNITPTAVPSRGLAKSRSMMHLNADTVTSQDDDNRAHVAVRRYASDGGFDVGLTQAPDTNRRTQSRSPERGQFVAGTGAYLDETPDPGHQRRRAQSLIPNISGREEKENRTMDSDVDALPREVDDEYLETIRGLPAVLFDMLADPLEELESATQTSGSSSFIEQNGDGPSTLRSARSVDRPRGCQDPEHRHARFFHEENAWDDRFSVVLPDGDDDDEEQVQRGEEPKPMAEGANGRLAHVAEMSPRSSSETAGNEDGGSSVRISEDILQEFEMVSPLPPRNAPAPVTHSLDQQIRDGGETERLTDTDISKVSSRLSSVAVQHPRASRSSQVNKPPISLVMTRASSEHAHLPSGRVGVYRSSSLISSYDRSTGSTMQTYSHSGSSSPSPSTSSKMDKLRRRVSESSIRNTVRRLTTLDSFATPRTSSPLATARSDRSSPREACDDRSSFQRPPRERSPSDWPRLRPQTPSPFVSSTRDGSNAMPKSLNLHARRISAESNASERSVIDIQPDTPFEDNIELDGRRISASDALAHYFEGTSGSESGSGRHSFSGEYLPALVSKRATTSSSISSLSSPLKTPISDEPPFHLLDKSQSPSSVVIVSQNPTRRDSVTSIASPNQFPRPFQHRPAGQFHLPWNQATSAHSRHTLPLPPTLTSSPMSSAHSSTTFSTSLATPAALSLTPVNPNTHQLSTKVVHAPSGVAVMLRLPRQISLHDLKEKVCAKFHEAADLDVPWDGSLAPATLERDSLLLYYRKSLGSTPALPSPRNSRNRPRSESVSSTGTSHDGSCQTFVRINSEDELIHVVGSIPTGEKLVLRLISATQDDMAEANI